MQPDHDIDAAFYAAREQVETREPPPKRGDAAPDDTPPLLPLGHRGGRYVFFSAAGELRQVPEDRIANSPVQVSLLGGKIDWAVQRFPQLDKEGVPTGWFSARALGKWMVEACHEVGLFSSDEPVRSYGVWRAGGVALAHLGDVVLDAATGEAQRAGFRRHGALWPAQPRLPGLRSGALPEPASAADVEAVEARWGAWTWEQIWAPRLVTGLWAAGLFGAAIPWRPHGLIVGNFGTGKSSLMNTIMALSPCGTEWNDFTEAGLRQALTGRAAMLVLDEAEGDEDGSQKLQKVIEMLRKASGGKGVRSVRGSAGGQSQTFEVSALALLGAILPPVLLPQDISRFSRVDLMAPRPDSPGLPDDAELVRMQREDAPALFARALRALPRMLANLKLFRAHIIGLGCAPRMADQVGTLLAARAAMLMDEPVNERQVELQARPLRELLVASADTEMEDGSGAVLAHLFGMPVDMTRRGERPTVGRLIAEGRLDDVAGSNARAILREHGMALVRWPAEAQGIPRSLLVANTHPRLSKLFEGTRWVGGKWREDLRRLPGACSPPTGQRALGATKPRCTVVSPELLPESERMADADLPP